MFWSFVTILLVSNTADQRGWMMIRGVDGFISPLGNMPTSQRTSLECSKPAFDSKNRHYRKFPRGSFTTTRKNTELQAIRMWTMPLPETLINARVLRMAESWAPVIGVITATLLYLAPARAVWGVFQKARKKGIESTATGIEELDLRDPLNGMNPLPIAIMPAVAVSWFAYGLVACDPYLIIGNLPGSILSVAYLIGILPIMDYTTAYPDSIAGLATEAVAAIGNPSLKPRKSKRLFWTHVTLLASVGVTLCLWALLGLVTAGAADGNFNIGGLGFGLGMEFGMRKGIICEALGLYAASLFICLSAFPLLTIGSILRTKNSRSILGPLTAAQCVNTGLWTAYGVASCDYFVWGPNIIVSAIVVRDSSIHRGDYFIPYKLCAFFHLLFAWISRDWFSG